MNPTVFKLLLDGHPPSDAGVRLARHYARSFVIMQLVSFRSKEMLRAKMAVEAESSAQVFAVYVSKACVRTRLVGCRLKEFATVIQLSNSGRERAKSSQDYESNDEKLRDRRELNSNHARTCDN